MMEPLVSLCILGNPVSWKAHAGYGRRSFNPLWREREYFQAKIREQYKGSLLDEQLEAEFLFYMPIPKATSKKMREKMLLGEVRPIVRPDRCNLLKFTEDCLIGIVITDDSIFVDGAVRKIYAEQPRTEINIWKV